MSSWVSGNHKTQRRLEVEGMENTSVAARRPDRWHGLAVGGGFGDGAAAPAGRAQFEAQHGQRASAKCRENLGNSEFAKMIDLQNVTHLLQTGKLHIDVFGKRAQCDSIVGDRYFVWFRVFFNSFLKFREGLAIDEQIVAQRDLDVMTGDFQAFKRAAQRDKVSLWITNVVLRGKARHDAVGSDKIKDIQPLNRGRGMGSSNFVVHPAARDVAVRGSEAH
jgi:hypothetical protein